MSVETLKRGLGTAHAMPALPALPADGFYILQSGWLRTAEVVQNSPRNFQSVAGDEMRHIEAHLFQVRVN